MARIIVIDDDFKICNNLKEILRNEGHDVECFTSAYRGLKQIEDKNFDIAIIDLIMPEIDGIELLSEIKRKKPNIQVIMITAFATIENAVAAMKKGAADYISKPFKLNEIQVAVKRVLEEARFEGKLATLERDADMDFIISALNSAVRRLVVMQLKKGRYTFTDIMKAVKAEQDPTKFNFHLRKLKQCGLVEQDMDKKYYLTPRGKKAFDILIQLGASDQ